MAEPARILDLPSFGSIRFHDYDSLLKVVVGFFMSTSIHKCGSEEGRGSNDGSAVVF